MTKVPERLLRPPEAYVDEQIRNTFALTGFGGMPLWTESGCTLFINAKSEVIGSMVENPPTIYFECEEFEGVPLIWFDLDITESGKKGQKISIFLDILNEQSVACLNALPYQRWIVLHWYDENINYVCSSGLEWSKGEGEKAQGAVSWAREVLQRTGGGDFEEAKSRVLSLGQ